jgi:hypothetical protein
VVDDNEDAVVNDNENRSGNRGPNGSLYISGSNLTQAMQI